jgi:hypothetical protein
LDHPAAYVECPLDPHGKGRHTLDGIVVEHGDQAVDVIALEGVDVAGQQFGVDLVQGSPPGP